MLSNKFRKVVLAVGAAVFCVSLVALVGGVYELDVVIATRTTWTTGWQLAEPEFMFRLEMGHVIGISFAAMVWAVMVDLLIGASRLASAAEPVAVEQQPTVRNYKETRGVVVGVGESNDVLDDGKGTVRMFHVSVEIPGAEGGKPEIVTFRDDGRFWDLPQAKLGFTVDIMYWVDDDDFANLQEFGIDWDATRESGAVTHRLQAATAADAAVAPADEVPDRYPQPKDDTRPLAFILQEPGFVPGFNMVSSVAGIIFNNDRALVLAFEHDCADFPGGHAKINEFDPETTLRRETREEAGTEIGVPKFVRAIMVQPEGEDPANCKYMVIMAAMATEYGEVSGKSERIIKTVDEFKAGYTGLESAMTAALIEEAHALMFSTSC